MTQEKNKIKSKNKKPMADVLWSAFEKTGSISAYLMYARQKRTKQRKASKSSAS